MLLRTKSDERQKYDSSSTKQVATIGRDLDVLFAVFTIARNDAEGEGFEPPVPIRAQRFSRPPHSTALAPLRCSESPILPSSRFVTSVAGGLTGGLIRRQVLRINKVNEAAVPVQHAVYMFFVKPFSSTV